MWKKTIKTIKDNPKMLWGFIVPVLAGLVLTFPIYRSIILTLLGDYSRIDDVPNFRELVRGFAIAAPIVYILMGVLVLPPLYGYVYKAVTGKEKKIWTKDGLLKYSWRVVVKSFMNFITLFAVFIVFFLFFAVPGLGFAMYTIAFSAWCVFWVISLTSAIVEDRFIDSLPNTFFVGGRYYLKMYFTSTIVMTPAIIFSALFLLYFHGVGMDIAYAVPTLDTNPKIIVLIFLTIAGFLSVYYVFAQSFLFTYSMHYYITEREKLDEEDRLKALAEEEDIE
ncbi:MAG: hypothetical protein JXN65_03235 [Clostridia bacterium]|nr:hypothetical protein [Clostridia bacterium]